MPPLVETNPYLHDPERRRQLLEKNIRGSSMAEGARGLKSPRASDTANDQPPPRQTRTDDSP